MNEEAEMTVEQLGAIIDFLTEQIVGIELHHSAPNVFAKYHVTQLRNYRRVMNDKLLALEAQRRVGA